MSNNQKVIPIINVEPLFSDNQAAWERVDNAMGEACQTYSGFVATGLPTPLRPDLAQVEKLLTFFDLPQSVLAEIGTKQTRPDSERNNRGYTANIGGFASAEIYNIGSGSPVSGPAIEDIDILMETNAWPSEEPVSGWKDEMNLHF